MADATLVAFAMIAGIMFIGFLGELIFRKYEIPGVLLMLGAGFAMGPMFHLVSQASMRSLQFIVGPLALLIVLFDAGMLLNIYTVIRQSVRPILFGVLLIIFSVIITALVAHYILNFDFTVGIIMGLVLGGGAPAITIVIAQRLKISEKAKTFLMLEPSFTDVLCAVLVIALTGLLLSGGVINARETGNSLLGTFAIGAVVGAVVGVVWLLALNMIEKITEYMYMATLAVLLFTYVTVEYFGASGLIAALIFGLILGNREDITAMLKLDVKHNTAGMAKLKPFHAEISFLVRTFFFTYLGMVVSVPTLPIILMAVVLIAGLYIARLAATWISTMGTELTKYRMLIASFVDRGLSVAVLSTYPLTVVSGMSGTGMDVIKQQLALFPDIAFMIILLAAVFSTIGITLNKPKQEDAMDPELAKMRSILVKKYGTGEPPERKGELANGEEEAEDAPEASQDEAANGPKEEAKPNEEANE